MAAWTDWSTQNLGELRRACQRITYVQHTCSINKNTMHRILVSDFELCNFIGFFSFVKCCARQQYPTTTKKKKKIKKIVDYLRRRTLLQPTIFFWYHFLHFLHQNYFELQKMSISNVLWLGGGFIHVSHVLIWYLPLKKEKKNYSQWKTFVKDLTKQRFLGKHGWYEVPENHQSPLKHSLNEKQSHMRGVL